MRLTNVTLLFEELKLVLFVREHDNNLIPTPGTQNLTIGWQVICDLNNMRLNLFKMFTSHYNRCSSMDRIVQQAAGSAVWIKIIIITRKNKNSSTVLYCRHWNHWWKEFGQSCSTMILIQDVLPTSISTCKILTLQHNQTLSIKALGPTWRHRSNILKNITMPKEILN